MSRPLTAQELHNLAMNLVGRDLEADGFEFLAVNSKLGKAHALKSEAKLYYAGVVFQMPKTGIYPLA